MPLFLTFFLVTGKGQRVKPVSLLLHVRDIAIRLVGNLILQASPPTSWPQSSQPSHTSDPSSTSLVSPALGEKQRCPWDTPGRHGKWISDSFFTQELLLSCHKSVGGRKWLFLFFPAVFCETALAATGCRGIGVLSVCFTHFEDTLWEHVSQETKNDNFFFFTPLRCNWNLTRSKETIINSGLHET